MSIWSNPPTATKAAFREGDTHLGVFSIQTALSVLAAIPDAFMRGFARPGQDFRDAALLTQGLVKGRKPGLPRAIGRSETQS